MDEMGREQEEARVQPEGVATAVGICRCTMMQTLKMGSVNFGRYVRLDLRSATTPFRTTYWIL